MDEILEAPIDAPVEAPVAPVEAPAEPQSRADTIREAMKSPTNRGKHAVHQPREGGKFAGAPQFPTPEPRPTMPKSLRMELQPHWEKAPHELLSAVNQREADYEKGIAQYKTRDAEAKSITDLFEPYQWMLRNEGATPQTAIAPLLQTAAILRTGSPAQKAQSVAQVMQQFGIPLEHIQQLFNGETPQQDNQYTQLAQQVQQLTQHISNSQHQQNQQNNARVHSEIAKFASNPAFTHFETLQPKMITLLENPGILGDISNLSDGEKLKVAYDVALRLDDTIPQFAQQQNVVQQVQKAKAAAIQVRGAPSSSASAAANINDRRAVIANAIRQAQH